MEKKTLQQFGADLKQKYPQYSHLSDEVVGRQGLLAKPEYRAVVDDSSLTQTSPGAVSSPTSPTVIRRVGESAEQTRLSQLPPGTPAQTAITQKPILPALGEQLGERKEQFRESFGASNPLRGLLRGVGAGAGAITDVIGAGLTGAFRALPDVIENPIRETAAAAIQSPTGQALMKPVGSGVEKYQGFAQANPELAKDIGAIGNIAGLFVGGAGGKIAKETVEQGVKNIAEQGIKNIATTAGKEVLNAAKTGVKAGTNVVKSVVGSFARGTEKVGSKIAPGLTEKVAEQARKLPTAYAKGKTAMAEAAAKSKRIQKSSPAVAKALKSNIDEVVVNTVENADQPTIKAFKEMKDIVKSGSKDIRPEKIAGDVPANQYKILDKELKRIGKEIGDEVDTLSKTTKVDMKPSITKLEKFIEDSYFNLTPNERNQVDQLLKLVKEQGDQLTPRQIYDKNKLFSKLQREAKLEGLGNIVIKTDDGVKNVFGEFRDVFSNKLDDVSTKIKGLNKQYKEKYDIIDNVEDEVFKGLDKASAKGLDIAEIAQTRLRSLLSDNQQRPFIQNTINKLDAEARKLGYNGAKAYDLIDFATELRKFYPDIVPKTSIGGILKEKGIPGVVGTVLDYGTAGVKQQQQALEELIDAMVKKGALKGLKKP